MLKKIIISILIPAFLLQVVGCYSQKIISKENLNKEKNKTIRIITNDDKECICESNFWCIENDTLVLSPNYRKGLFEEQKIPIDSIQTVYTSHFNITGTIILVAHIVLLIAGSAIVAHQWGH